MMKWWRDLCFKEKTKTKGNQRLTDFFEKKMQRRGYKGTSTRLFEAQIPSQSTSASEGTDYLEHVDCARI